MDEEEELDVEEEDEDEEDDEDENRTASGAAISDDGEFNNDADEMSNEDEDIEPNNLFNPISHKPNMSIQKFLDS